MFQELVDNKKIKDIVDFDIFVGLGFVGKNEMVKILGRGELKLKLKVFVYKFIVFVKVVIEGVGGEVVIL